MKIVMLCRLYYPHIGGVEKHVAGVSREAIKDGHTVDIFTLKNGVKLPSRDVVDGVHVHRIAVSRSKYVERVQLYIWMIWNVFLFLRADVIQIHDVFYWYWPLRIILPWKKVYITYHGFEAGTLPTEKAKRTRQMIQRWTNGSVAIGAWIEKWYGTKADVVSYGAGECSTISKTKPNGLVDAVFLGRLSDDTGISVYVETISNLKNIQLDVFGAGERKAWVRDMSRKTKNVTVLGTTEDSCSVFPQYDFACVSSYLAIIEAMQCQTLVVAYAVDELKYDYLRAHPRANDMIIVRTAEELESFFRNYSPEKYKAKVESAYSWARQQTWERVYQKYQKLWREQ